MYERLYKQAPEKSDSKKSRKKNKAGIPNSVKTRLEEMPGYSHDDIRIHYASGKPTQFITLAHTQENQVHYAHGTEEYPEREPENVVQKKEDLAKSAFRIGNTLVNDETALEQKTDNRLHSKQDFALTGRSIHREQDVLQGKFVNAKITKTPYFQQIGILLDHFCAAGLESFSIYHELEKKPELCDVFIRNFDDIYEQIEEEVKKNADLKRDLARFDILKNLLDHYGTKTQNDVSYTHYHMYDDGSLVCDDNNQENPLYESDSPLASVIDCRKIKIHVNGLQSDNVLWIESFVSFQKGAGKSLIHALLDDDRNKDIEYVALGAYPGTGDYYRKTLHMEKLHGAYIPENGTEILNQESAVNEVKKHGDELGISKRSSDIDYIKRGLKCFLLYPVYYLDKKTLPDVTSSVQDSPASLKHAAGETEAIK